MTCKTDECDKIYVRWTWAVGLLSASLLTIAGLSWAGGSKLTSTETRLHIVENRVETVEKMNMKLDTITTLLRAKK